MVEKFFKDINHGSKHKDDDSSTGPIKSNTGSKDQSKGFYGQKKTRIPQILSIYEASDRRSSMEYTIATIGKCHVEEELINHSINSLYS